MQIRSRRARPLRLLTAIACWYGLSGCDSSAPSYFPLGPGTQWQYHVTRTTMDGTAVQKYRVEAIAPRLWQGQQVHVKQTLDGRRLAYKSDKDGIRRVAQQLGDEQDLKETSPPFTLIPKAPQVGTRWRGHTITRVLENSGPPWETLYRIMETIELDFEIESVDDVVRVPAGEFHNCLRIVGRGKKSSEVGNYIRRATISVELVDWYAPNIGLVRSERHEHTDAEAIDRGVLIRELEYFRK